MKKIYLAILVALSSIYSTIHAQQVPNAGFEDWSGAAFDGNAQPASWNVSNVTQFGFKFNFAHKEAGHTGSASVMVQDQSVGAAGITEVSPGYFSLGQPWVYIKNLTSVSEATAGTEGGISWKYRPDTMSVWIKRTGSNVTREDFYLLYYAWSGTAKSSKYKGKNGKCTSVSKTNEESDVRQALDGNECGTDQIANQIAEGMWREKKEYGEWTNIRVPIYYMNSDVPTMMNIIFSASNYPNFRANSGLYAGNSLYVDDVELIYSSKIQKIYIDDKEWRGFDPNSSEEQSYSLGRGATSIPKIEAYRGAGALTNAAGKTANFTGRLLSGDEINIQQGAIDGAPTVITVKAEDGKSSSTYRIKFVREASTNAKLANIYVNGKAISGFNGGIFAYNAALPYGTTETPVVSVDAAEDAQTVEITQATSTSGTATIRVTAADKKTTATYTIRFSVEQLSDNTLKDILVNGKSIPGFIPSQTIYRVSLPTGTTQMPTVKGVSAYPEGAQTITYTAPANLDGGTYQVAVTTPGNKVPKVYKLNIKLEASTYSYLKNLQVEGGYITDFQPDNLTYYVTLPMGTTKLPAITFEQGDDYQTVSVAEGGLDGTTRVTVTAASGDQTVYKIVFSTLKSEISTLKGIRIGGKDLEGFSADKTDYTYTLPIGTTELPSIEPVKNDEYQSVNVIPGGVNGTTRITVTAGNGNTTIYQIAFSVNQASDATLQMIYIDSKPLEGYNKEQLEYTIHLPQGTTRQPVVTYTPNDEYQTITVRQGSNVEDDYKITVRPQTGASRTYILHFRVATSANTALSMIYVEGKPLEGFAAAKTEYTYPLPEGISTIPSVTYDKSEESQKVLSMCEDNIHTLTVTAENGDKRTYTITFIIKKSENAFLRMIYLDGKPLDNFEKTILNYTRPLTGATCPVITVEKEAGQQVTITSPYAAGTAQIRVAPETGAANIYTITFTAEAVAAAQLQAIFVDGKPLQDFSPNRTNYELAYTDALPAITYTAEEGQTVQVLRNGENVALYVQSEQATAVYTIRLTRQVSNDCALSAILLDGKPMAGYTASQHDYVVDLPAGSQPQVVTYRRGNDKQVIYFGQAEENKMAITVVAETGAMATYTVAFRIAKYDDARLQDMRVDGHDIAFDPDKTEYTLSIDDGAPLPRLTYTPRNGQNIIAADVNANEQQVSVVAESGATKTYIIKYARVKSSNALLADIMVNGVSMKGFQPTLFQYTDTLPWRTSVVPNVFAVGQLPNQTITTCYSSVNGTTTIRVEAADGTTSNTYAIAFPVRKSANTTLEDMYLNSEIAQLTFRPNVTDYTVMLPYQTKQSPVITFAKAETEQQTEYFLRPMGQPNTITVTAENGDKRTYSVLFEDSLATAPNLLDSLAVRETGEQLDVRGTELTVALPYGTRSLTVDYAKAFDEQTVWIQPGGVTDTTFITVRSNRPNDPDHIYTLIPQLDTQNPAVLESITIDGKPIAGFDKNRFTYIVNCTTSTSMPNVDYTKAGDVQYRRTANDQWHWQATVSKGGCSNTYTIFFHYPNEVIPNADFTEWETAKYNGGTKPTGWQVPADFFNEVCVLSCSKTGAEVVKATESSVGLKTKYWSAAGGALPAIITLGSLSGSMAVDNKTHYDISDYIRFHNTPDAISVNYQYKAKKGNGALFAYRFKGVENEKDVTYNFDYQQTNTSSSYVTHTQPLALDGKHITGMNIAVDATNESSGATGGAELYVDWFKLHYNSTLSALKVNGIPATINGKVFSVTLTDPEYTAVPQLSFTGEVSDQAQRVVWQSETIKGNYGVRRAVITNYAEDGSSTPYTLEVRRPLDTRTALKALYADSTDIFSLDTADYTIHLTSDTRHLPSVYPVPASSLQSITTSYADSVYTITVQPESGEPKTYRVRFVTDLSDDATLATIAGIADFDPDVFQYSVAADQAANLMPSKKAEGQTIHVVSSPKQVRFEVTAETGKKNTYIVSLTYPEHTTAGTLQELELNHNIYSDFSADRYDYTLARPTYAAFVRTDAQDSVVFVQTPTHMQWQVSGTESHTYTITYPTALSANTRLASILLNGQTYGDFAPSVSNYQLYTDSCVNMSIVKAEESQTVNTTFDAESRTYTIGVTAPDGTTGTPYTIRLLPVLSPDNTLSSIFLDGNEIPNYDPAIQQYTITLPTPAIKTAEPQMPSLTYTAGHHAQQVELSAGSLETPTYLTVTSEDGKVKEYTINVQAEPSHNADLTGIIVNDVPVQRFEAGRHYYSVRSEKEQADIQWTSEDNYQTVILQPANDAGYVLHVTAQDGATTQDYTVDVFTETQSNDATLANILLDGMSFVDFERALNPKLTFSPMQNSYSIHLPSGTTTLPEVSATMRVEGQNVSISSRGMTIYLDVTASDGIATNRYSLDFSVPLSANANLGMIYLNGDSLPNFDPAYYFYQVVLPVGTHTLPEIVAQKAEAKQQITALNIDSATRRATVQVLAEDSVATSTYVLLFQFTQSDADTLRMIYADGMPIDAFAPNKFYYSLSLPVGTTAFPELSWNTADDWQNVRQDTVEASANRLVRQFVVTSESGRSNYYTVAYDILKSDVDTLQMIYINEKPIDNFRAAATEYWYTVSAQTTELPAIYALQGDPYQTIRTTYSIDSITTKSLGKKADIEVVAGNGMRRIYTIHFPQELSSDATLNMILVGGQNLSDYDSERFSYRVALPANATSIPVITVIKKEDAQVVEINMNQDTVRVAVTAEDLTRQTYTLVFERTKSDNANLKDITLGNGYSIDFDPTHYDYAITLPFGTDSLPVITPVKADDEQQIELTLHELPDTGEQIVTITVTAPNEFDQCAYTITFTTAKNNDATLTALYVRDTLLPHFSPDTTEYTIVYTADTDSSMLATANDIRCVASDSLATVTVDAESSTTIIVTVTAQDGTIRTYIIYQVITADTENTIRMIYLDDMPIVDFDPERTFYTYYIGEGGTTPKVTAEAVSVHADVNIKEVPVGDTCIITCTAASGEARKYHVWFAASTINTAATPTANDVLVKHIAGTDQVIFATLRKNVFVAVYTQRGELVFYAPVPESDQNDATVVISSEGTERLIDVANPQAECHLPNGNQTYIYTFLENEKRRISSGKISVIR